VKGARAKALTEWQKRGFARAEAEVLKTLNLMPEKYPLEFGHGMTKTEVEQKHKILVKEGLFNHILTVYDNKMRALFKRKLAGRHTVHGERHYFAVAKNEDKLVNHVGCEDCEPIKKELCVEDAEKHES